MASSTRTRRDEDSFIADTPLAPIGGNQIQSFAGDVLSQQTGAIGKSVGGAFGMFEKLSDYHSTKMAEEQLDSIRERAEEEANAGMNDAPGSPRSWFLADGSIDKDKVNDFRTRYNEEYASVKPSFWRSESQMAWNKSYDDYVRNSDERLAGQALRGQAAAVRRVSKAALDNKLLKGDMKGYADELQNQVAANILTPTEAENMLLTQAKKNLTGGGGGGGGSVYIGAGNVDGFEAILAANAARSGGGVPAAAPAPAAVQVGKPVQEKKPAKQDLTMDVGGTSIDIAPSFDFGEVSPVAGANALAGVAPEVSTPVPELTAGQKWAYNGDSTGIVQALSPTELGSFQNYLIEEDGKLKMTASPQGQVWHAGMSADDLAKAIAAKANAVGELSKEDAEFYANNICYDRLLQNPNVSLAAVQNIMKGSGVFEALGDGNEDAGKAEVGAIYERVKGSMKEERGKKVDGLINGIVEREIPYLKMYDSNGDFQDYVFLRNQSNRLVAENAPEWTKPSDDKVDEMKDWIRYKELYKEYAPLLKLPCPSDDKELENAMSKNAVLFFQGYDERFGKGQEKFAEKTAEITLRTSISKSVQNKMDEQGVKELDYLSYSDAVKEGVAACKGSGLSGASKEYMKVLDASRITSERAARRRSDASDAAMEVINERREENAEIKVMQKDLEKKQKAEQKAAERAVTKANEEKAKQEARVKDAETKRKLNTPQIRHCGWDGKTMQQRAQTGDFSPYGLSIAVLPQDMIDEIKSSGWTPDQNVYLHIQGQSVTKIPVDMNNISKSGNIELSSHALLAALKGNKKKMKPGDVKNEFDGIVSISIGR